MDTRLHVLTKGTMNCVMVSAGKTFVCPYPDSCLCIPLFKGPGWCKAKSRVRLAFCHRNESPKSYQRHQRLKHFKGGNERLPGPLQKLNEISWCESALKIT